MTEEIHAERAVPTGHEAEASLEELLAFERLLSDLSARFANVADEQVIAEIESALEYSESAGAQEYRDWLVAESSG